MNGKQPQEPWEYGSFSSHLAYQPPPRSYERSVLPPAVPAVLLLRSERSRRGTAIRHPDRDAYAAGLSRCDRIYRTGSTIISSANELINPPKITATSGR